MSIVTENTPIAVERSVGRMDMSLVAHYVRRYLEGSPHQSPGLIEVAKAAIALEQAYAKRGEQRYVPGAASSWDESDEDARRRALALLGNGYPVRGVSWGIPRAQIPYGALLGEFVRIKYSSLGDPAFAAGFVAERIDVPRGSGWVIRLTETSNGFNIQPGGWRYVALWAPANGGMAGFV